MSRAEEELRRRGKRSVLVVDDEEGVLRIAVKLLEREGFVVYTAKDAHQAIEMMGRQPFGVLLLDKNLDEKGSGIDILRHAQRHLPFTKSIMITGSPSAQSAIEAVQLGAFDYLTKPVALDVLVKRVTEASEAFAHDSDRDDVAARHDSLFELIPGLVWFADSDGIIRRINQRGASALGYQADELVGKSYTKLIDDDDPPLSVKWAFTERRVGVRATKAKLISFVTKSSERRLYQVNSSGGQLSTKDGTEAVSVGVAHDVTELVGMHQRLRRSDKTEALGHLVAEVVHEFSGLLTIINGSCELLQLRGCAAGDEQEIEAISEAGRRALALVQRLRGFARDEPVELRAISLAKVVAAQTRLLEQLLTGQYRLSISDELDGAEILGDWQQIEQVVMNLVINARDAMPIGGVVRVATSTLTVGTKREAAAIKIPMGRYATLSVSDTGVGMSPEELARAREPFHTTKPAGKGSGIGLAVVDRIVRQHDGHIQFSTSPNNGTVVTAYFPLHIPAVGGA